MNKTQKDYLDTYLDSLSCKQRELINQIVVEHFCTNQKDANELAKLVCDGTKTATCSLKYCYDVHEENNAPMVGNIMLVTDFFGTPVCVVQTTSVKIKPFCDVGEDFAFLEGEGDKTLEYWQKSHWQFFSQVCEHEGIEPQKNMQLYLEQFKVVFQ